MQIRFDRQLKEASFKANIEEQHLWPLTLLHSVERLLLGSCHSEVRVLLHFHPRAQI